MMRFLKYGYFLIDFGRRRRNRDVFTLLDLLGRKVRYIYDGLESIRDEVIFNMKIVINGFGDFVEMQKFYIFIFLIFIELVDDKFILQLLGSFYSEVFLIMVKNIKLRVIRFIVEVFDLDFLFFFLVILIVCRLKYLGKLLGYFEIFDRVGIERFIFFFQEIIDGRIWFLLGVDLLFCLLIVGIFIKRLIIDVVDMNLYLNIFGIRVIQGSYIIIGRKNLVVIDNVFM